jgi:hypothetical protein
MLKGTHAWTIFGTVFQPFLYYTARSSVKKVIISDLKGENQFSRDMGVQYD